MLLDKVQNSPSQNSLSRTFPAPSCKWCFGRSELGEVRGEIHNWPSSIWISTTLSPSPTILCQAYVKYLPLDFRLVQALRPILLVVWLKAGDIIEAATYNQCLRRMSERGIDFVSLSVQLKWRDSHVLEKKKVQAFPTHFAQIGWVPMKRSKKSDCRGQSSDCFPLPRVVNVYESHCLFN